MKTSRFIIILLVFTSCKTKYQEVFDKFSNGHPKEVRIYDDKKNKDDYNIIFYFENDSVKFKGTVKNNQYVGQKISYYKTGILQQIDSLIKPCNFDFCCCDGKVTRFDSTGKLVETFEVRNGEKNGKAFIYKQNDKLDITKIYKDGKVNGETIYFYDNGLKEVLANHKNDTLVNYIYYFNENGDTAKYYNHHNGVMAFPYKKWLDNGLILYGNYTNDKEKEVLWQWFDKSGKETKREIRKAQSTGFVAPD